MDFAQAIKSCFSQYAGFTGRAPRSEFWWFALFQILVLLVTAFISEIAYAIAALALLLPVLAVGARRLHEIWPFGLVATAVADWHRRPGAAVLVGAAQRRVIDSA